MPTSYTAVWSAVAASFSAMSAFIVMTIQRRNFIESVRPDLLPVDWSRATQGDHEVIRFGKIRNYGRGPAFNVVVMHGKIERNERLPHLMVPWISLQVIGPNESVEVDGSIDIYWDGIKGDKGQLIQLVLLYSDTRNVRYITNCSQYADRGEIPVYPLPDLGPKLSSQSRETFRRSYWRMVAGRRVRALWRRLRSVPGKASRGGV